MRSLPNRFSDWVVSHPVMWGVGLGAVLVLLGLALDLTPVAVLAAGAAIGVLNILHAKRRGYCPLPADRIPQRGEVAVAGAIQGATPNPWPDRSGQSPLRRTPDQERR